MAIIIRSPLRYIQGQGELAQIALHTKSLGTNFFVLCSENTRKRIEPFIGKSLEEAGKKLHWCIFSGKCTHAEIERVTNELKAAGCDVMLGAGGGKVIDTAKAVADNLNLPVIIVPTVASNDAPCTALAVIYNDEGVVVKAQFTKRSPDVVLVDSAMLAKTPVRLFAAGIGDALASWFETRAVHASGSKTLARGHCSTTALMMAKLCYDILVKDGAQAVADVRQGQISPAVEQVLEATIYLSGISAESGGLAAAHAINDGLVYMVHDMYHGERVAFGTLAQLVLEKAPKEEMHAVMQLLHASGLPMSFAQLGIKGAPDEALLRKVAEAACVPTQFTKNMPFPVTADDVYKAMLEADRLGSAFNQ